MNKFIKLTYHISDFKKISSYRSPPFNFDDLNDKIDEVFHEGLCKPREYRIFWKDEAQDEVRIANHTDYSMFCHYQSKTIHVVPLDVPTEVADAKTTQIPSTDKSYDTIVHKNVTCDACNVKPLLGFRYKCIRCPDFDLCENCEAKHIHAEHMMVRMPNNNCRDLLKSYLSLHDKKLRSPPAATKNPENRSLDRDHRSNLSDSEGMPSTYNVDETIKFITNEVLSKLHINSFCHRNISPSPWSSMPLKPFYIATENNVAEIIEAVTNEVYSKLNITGVNLK